MKIERQVVQRFMHELAIEQIQTEYQRRGYQVRREVSLGNFRADLVAERGSDKIIFEVKYSTNQQDRLRQNESIRQIHSWVKEHSDYKFQLVFASPPGNKEVDVPDLDTLLLQYYNDDSANAPEGLDGLPSHPVIEDIVDVEIDSLTLETDGRINIKGTAIVSVESHDNEGRLFSDSLPSVFDLVLSTEGRATRIEEVNLWKLDTSSWFE